MQEAKDIIDMAAPFFGYIAPAVFIFSFMAFADLILDFSLNIVRNIKNNMRFS